MRQFNYTNLKESSWSSSILSYVSSIREHKGKQELYIRQKPVEVERLVEVARIQSTESSNKIEGIGTSRTRIRQLVQEKSTPRDCDEQEIAGYRDVLSTIHESYEFIPLTPHVILQFHRDLLSYTDKSFGGKFKNTQNFINEFHADGTTLTRFTPREPYETPDAVDEICRSYQQAIAQQVVDPLILIPIFICDFLCIHPFNDGNGRMSRLLTTLLLYKSGFMVGKYISVERKIEKTKASYYDALRQVSTDWHEGRNDYTSFIKYFLGIVLNCYKDFENRLGSVDRKSTPYDIVREAVNERVGTFTKMEILELCPSIKSSSVEAALKRLKEEGYIFSQGGGRSTSYVRNPEYQ
ncbi:Fic family protein [Parasphaerochaeta coccoides]|uniref:Filamentation induced by cAMP protein Fic n=1 Tax=Parasphaerochaeta coccoides (strain ATCC BAA-1237 / DSM 17374 / SPN1) TaxID=760011 RepID=F4GIT4_PARC1|nr:Fic family protein [Parasphaerochaeta coccoides]AEC02702.1 filamentation induced by cAMP protein Fic [Parasphaerochaeta coccoides DSM 17374]